MNLSDAELIARLSQTEDSFVERKSQSDKGGWVRTTVAFANSAPVGQPAILFIGVNNDGSIESGVNAERAIQSFSDSISKSVWPPIISFPRAMNFTGKDFVAVLIPGSPERPHFAGRAYVRAGTQTMDASDDEYKRLIASRASKAREILDNAGQDISWLARGPRSNDSFASARVKVRDCNSHYATFDFLVDGGTWESRSEPLSRLELARDHRYHRLQVICYLER